MDNLLHDEKVFFRECPFSQPTKGSQSTQSRRYKKKHFLALYPSLLSEMTRSYAAERPQIIHQKNTPTLTQIPTTPTLLKQKTEGRSMDGLQH